MKEENAKLFHKGDIVTFKDGRGSYPLSSDPIYESLADGGDETYYFKLEGFSGFFHRNFFSDPE